MFLCCLSFGCWAPEVESPAPKLSPAEIAGMSIATASASSLEPSSMRHIPSQQALIAPQQRSANEETSEAPQDSPVPLDNQKSFPYEAQIQGENVPLLGHGGGTIMMLSTNELKTATLEVLEERDGKAHVLCRGCSPSHPYQAGWISMDYIQAKN